MRDSISVGYQGYPAAQSFSRASDDPRVTFFFRRVGAPVGGDAAGDAAHNAPLDRRFADQLTATVLSHGGGP
jgi:hypothetical protein